LLRSEYLGHQIDEARTAEIISADEARKLRDYHEKVTALLSVDDFAPHEIGRLGYDAHNTPDDGTGKAVEPTTSKKKPKRKGTASRAKTKASKKN
jgi:hypothetical protein